MDKFEFSEEDPQIAKNKALRNAVKSLDVEEARKLLAAGANPRYIPPYNEESHVIITSLIDYWKDEAVDMVRLLLDYRLHPVSLQCIFGALCFADPFMGSRRYELLDLVIDRGLPLNETILYKPSDGEFTMVNTDYTPLEMSILSGDYKIVQTLLESGADISSGENIPLHIVLYDNRTLDKNQNLRLVRYLLEQGADARQNHELAGGTPLHLAFSWGARWECISALLEYGADLNALDRRCITPIMIQTNMEAEIKIRVSKEMAKLRFQGKFISEKNMEHLRRLEALVLLEQGLRELAEMKALRLTEKSTLYSALITRCSFVDLALVEKIYAFLETGNVSLFKDDILQVVKTIVTNRNILQCEKNKLSSIFANILPDLIIEKIAFFAIVDSLPKSLS